MKSSLLKSLLILPVLMLLAAQAAVGQSAIMGSTLDKVDVAVISRYDTLTAGAEGEYAVVLDIKEGWHLNAHNPTLDYLIGVNLDIGFNDIAMTSDIQYPNPVWMQFSFAQEELKVYEGKAIILVKLKSSTNLKPGSHYITGDLKIQACSDEVCLPPSTAEITFPLAIGDQKAASAHEQLFQKLGSRDPAALSSASDNQIASIINESGYFLAFLSIFLIGLALNLTPCVYPMMSVTVSLFAGNEESRTASAFSRAFVYVMGIVFMYSFLGVIAAYTGGLFGSWLQSSWILAGIGILIFVLALSMFGLYELQPPAWMMQKLGKTQQASGYLGHFLSGLLVGVFAAPCIGPPIIALLAFVGSQGSPLFGFFAFFVMALGLGIPYLILGTFSGLLDKMPKSGVWMIWVKKVFGVVLIGVALFYLSLAFAPNYSMYVVLVTLIIGGIYLGFIENSGNEKSLFRRFKMALGIGALVAAFFLFQNLQKEGVKWQEYDIALITQTDKPVMLDFYADWCIPCIQMDRQTFTDSRIVITTKSFLRMKIDLTHFDSKRAEKLRKKYDIAGVPTIMFLNANGNEIEKARVVGFMGADAFLKRIKMVKQQATAYSE